MFYKNMVPIQCVSAYVVTNFYSMQKIIHIFHKNMVFLQSVSAYVAPSVSL